MEKKLQIYLVDDSQEMIQKMKNNLKNSHLFEVIGSASNGEQCLHELNGHTIDVLILDLIMPGMDGMEVLSNLKKHAIRVQHILCTTPILNDFIISQIQQYDVDYILMKPFELQSLEQRCASSADFTPKAPSRMRWYRSISMRKNASACRSWNWKARSHRCCTRSAFRRTSRATCICVPPSWRHI